VLGVAIIEFCKMGKSLKGGCCVLVRPGMSGGMGGFVLEMEGMSRWDYEEVDGENKPCVW
jgi:hypothetical protein